MHLEGGRCIADRAIDDDSTSLLPFCLGGTAPAAVHTIALHVFYESCGLWETVACLEGGGCIADKAVIHGHNIAIAALLNRHSACSGPHSSAARVRADGQLLARRAQLHDSIVQNIVEPPLSVAI